jgi:hypothetical protein
VNGDTVAGALGRRTDEASDEACAPAGACTCSLRKYSAACNFLLLEVQVDEEGRWKGEGVDSSPV